MTTNKLTTIAALAATALALAACGSEPTPDIAVPAEQHLQGRWTLTNTSILAGRGWVADTLGRASGAVDFLPGGKAVVVDIAPDGEAVARAAAWTADDNSRVVALGGRTAMLTALSSSHFQIVHSHSLIRADSLNAPCGLYRSDFVRSDSSNIFLAEKILGNWKFVASYEKTGGQWRENTFGVPDISNYHFREGGSLTTFARKGDIRRVVDLRWSANEANGGTLTLGYNKGPAERVRASVEGDTLSIYYTNNYDDVSRTMKAGEFRDVLARLPE